MKNFEEDKKLKTLIQSIDIDTPGKGFSTKVMNQIFELDSYIEKLKSERVLGKSFWVITSVFVVLMLALIAVSVMGTTGSEGNLLGLFKGLGTSGVSEGYENAYEKVTSLPLSIAGILLASSLLVFLERFLSTKNKIKA